MKRAIQISVLVGTLLVVSKAASANELTEVIDSFDYAANDMFDLNFSIGYRLESKRGNIRRETTLKDPQRWDHYAYTNMFKFKQVRHILDLNLEVGLFRDVSIRFGLPLILSDTRTLSAHPDWDGTWQLRLGGRDLDQHRKEERLGRHLAGHGGPVQLSPLRRFREQRERELRFPQAERGRLLHRGALGQPPGSEPGRDLSHLDPLSRGALRRGQAHEGLLRGRSARAGR